MFEIYHGVIGSYAVCTRCDTYHWHNFRLWRLIHRFTHGFED